MRALAVARVPDRAPSPARARAGRSVAPAPAHGTVAGLWPTVLDVAGVLALQRTAGNAAVATALQRSPLATPKAAPPKRPLLRRGSKGTQVKVLQQRLNALGTTPPLKVDGDFGQKTFDAVVAFQKEHFPDDEKQWDGKVGPLTWGAIDEAYQAPEIAEDEASTGKKVVEGMDRVNAGGGSADSGVWYPYNYRQYHPEKYRPDMEGGYADPTYFEHKEFMDWKLKPRMSASAAIRSWLDGLTIAECYTAMIAIEYETLRAAVGNEAFDRQFGSTDAVTPAERRLAIFSGKPVIRTKFMKKTAAAEKMDEGTAGDRPARVGDWYYFMNHPRYLLKHPGGAWQGENAIYVGREGGVQKWAGMGTSNESATNPSSHVTEAEMLASMVGAYNLDRDVDDAAALVRITAANKGVLPPVLDPANKAYPEKINGPADILNAKPEKLNVPEHVVDDTERKGGFVATAGKALDPEAVKKLREGETVE
jgi:peptidoglycan hydrolase-like protein with peptidoglycan-binding domain